MDIAREDMLLVFILAAFIAPFAYSYLTGPETTASDETLQFCRDTAEGVETNATPPGTTCECIPPGTFNEQPYTTAEEVKNLTDLFLVRCDIPDQEQDFILPVRRIENNTAVNETLGGNISGNGTTVLE